MSRLFLQLRQSCLCRFRFAEFWMNVVRCNNQMLIIDQLDLRAPAPVRSAGGIGVTAEDRESVFDRLSNAEHDGCIVVERIYPRSFETVQRRVVAEHEHSMLRLVFYSGLIEEESETP